MQAFLCQFIIISLHGTERKAGRRSVECAVPFVWPPWQGFFLVEVATISSQLHAGTPQLVPTCVYLAPDAAIRCVDYRCTPQCTTYASAGMSVRVPFPVLRECCLCALCKLYESFSSRHFVCVLAYILKCGSP